MQLKDVQIGKVFVFLDDVRDAEKGSFEHMLVYEKFTEDTVLRRATNEVLDRPLTTEVIVLVM